MSLSLLVAIVGVLSGAADPSVRDLSAVQLLPQAPPVQRAGQGPASLDAMREIAPVQKRSPFSGAFRSSKASPAQANRGSSRVTTPNPRVVCGLTMYEMSSDLDPKAIVTLPDRRVDVKIRRIIPSTCRE